MKKLTYFLSLFFFLGNFYAVNGQDSSQELPADYKKRHALYDYSEKELSNTDTIPDFSSKPNPLKISGTVYLSDGVTPAKDVILFVTQPDENGDYELKTHLKKRYVHHRAWVKTDADGQYTFYTFIPGKDRHSTALKSIHLAIKEPNKTELDTTDFLFDDDPLLRNSCRKKLAERGTANILKLEKKENMFFAARDIVLEDHKNEYANN